MHVVHALQELKAPWMAVSTYGGETTAASWKWFDAMDEVMGIRPSITPTVLISSSVAPTLAAVASPPEQGTPSSSRRKRESEWLTFLWEFQDQEEEQ